ncbi:butanoate--CoA ligase AAE1-like isoform X2 [Diospyros lotus]|uniref:butanoate--CoA ligase AAE1-like isoform X2 n=1 Tax=Diospyros lotus TaxID=55363 RepID=UPI002254E418|nr:butanoate--CoA ligase AAE1-like isoform X2 [Diospyros lotus]
MEGLVKCSANYVPLSPISFLERAAFVCGEKVSVVYGSHIRYTWRQTHARCINLASALSQLGLRPGDVVAALAPNIPALYELHFGVPMAGAVLSALNTRLNASMLELLLQELQAKFLFVDYQFIEVVLKALKLITLAKAKPPFLVLIPESDLSNHQEIAPSTVEKLPPGSLHYDQLLAMGKYGFEPIRPADECQPISVNFTSGSTGKPKGAVYSHRAAYLNSIARILAGDMRPIPVFLWTVDMFRCNGWCFTWAMAAMGGTNICIRSLTAKAIFDAIHLHKVTLLCGAPAILSLIAEAPAADHTLLPSKVEILVAGALPSGKAVNKVQELGFSVSHLYGMTEALGPFTAQSLKPPKDDQASGEGIHNPMMEEIDVKDPETMISLPSDGKTIGEVMFRSNTLMSGYLKNPQATQKAFRGGWYRSGDLGVRLPNRCIEIKDRAVDKIQSSGGEMISSLEVEAVVAGHSMVAAVAVVGRLDGAVGETACAFVTLKEGCNGTAEEIVEFCRVRLPQYMVPKSVVFMDLPVNSIGKVQKFVLRSSLSLSPAAAFYLWCPSSSNPLSLSFSSGRDVPSTSGVLSLPGVSSTYSSPPLSPTCHLPITAQQRPSTLSGVLSNSGRGVPSTSSVLSLSRVGGRFINLFGLPEET